MLNFLGFKYVLTVMKNDLTVAGFPSNLTNLIPVYHDQEKNTYIAFLPMFILAPHPHWPCLLKWFKHIPATTREESSRGEEREVAVMAVLADKVYWMDPKPNNSKKWSCLFIIVSCFQLLRSVWTRTSRRCRVTSPTSGFPLLKTARSCRFPTTQRLTVSWVNDLTTRLCRFPTTQRSTVSWVNDLTTRLCRFPTTQRSTVSWDNDLNVQYSYMSEVSALKRSNTENSKQIFLFFWELRGHSPNFHIHVSLSDLYIPTIDLPILLQEISWKYINPSQTQKRKT